MCADIASIGLRIESQGLSQGLSRLKGLEQQGARTEKTISGMTMATSKLAGAMGALGIAMSAGKAISTIQQFDESLTKLRAISGATATDMKLLTAQARELGATTVYGANQAAEAQTFLAQAGLSVNEVLKATPAVLELAQAGMLDLGQAADLATDIMGQMGLGVEDISRISDVLVKSANSATTTVSQLAEGFSYAGPVAKAFGLSIEETSAALAMISNNGIKAGRAGTGLLGVLRQLGNVTPQNEALLKEYGLTIADVDVSSRGFQAVIDTLAKANLRAADSFQLFGSEAASSGLALTRGAAAYNRLTETLGDSAGAARDTARIMSSDLTSAFKSLNSAVDEFVLQVGDGGAAGGLKELVTTAAGAVSVINGMGDEFVAAGGYSEDFAARINAIAGPIVELDRQWDEFVESFGNGIAEGRNMLTQMEASLMDARSSLYSLGASSVEAFAGLSEGARSAISAGLNKIIEALNYIDGSFANLLDNVGAFLGPLGSGMRESAASIRNGLIEPLDLSNSALGESAKKLREQSAAAADAANAMRSVDYVAQREAVKGYGNELDIIASYNENFVSSLGEALGPMDAYIQKTLEAQGASTKSAAATKEDSAAKREQEKALRDAQRAQEKFASSLQSLTDKLDPVSAAQREFTREQVLLQTALMNGSISMDKYLNLYQRLQEAQLSTQSPSQAYGHGFGGEIASRGVVGRPNAAPGQGLGGQGTGNSELDQWMQNARANFESFDNLAASTAMTFSQSFGTAFNDILTGQTSINEGFRQMGSTLVQSVISAIGQMIAQWLALQAVQLATGASGTAAAIGQAAVAGPAIAAAYTPAATMVSLATLGANSPPAIAGIAATAAAAKGASIIGQAHSGWDELPATGTYNLQKGERVVSARQNADLTSYLSNRGSQQQQGGGSPVSVVVNNIEDKSRAGTQTSSQEGNTITVQNFVNDIANDGKMAKALQGTYMLKRKGK